MAITWWFTSLTMVNDSYKQGDLVCTTRVIFLLLAAQNPANGRSYYCTVLAVRTLPQKFPSNVE